MGQLPDKETTIKGWDEYGNPAVEATKAVNLVKEVTEKAAENIDVDAAVESVEKEKAVYVKDAE